MKIKLIDNWRSAWRYLSFQLAALLTILSALEPFLPQISTYLPEYWQVVLGGAVLVARVIQQTNIAVKELPKEPSNEGKDT